MEKIIRSICSFSKQIDPILIKEQEALVQQLKKAGFSIQTQRFCASEASISEIEQQFSGNENEYLFAIGSLDRKQTQPQLGAFLQAQTPIAFNLQISDEVRPEDVDVLFQIIQKAPSKTFHFTFSFNNAYNSPYFPASNFGKAGFSIGLQPTNLATGRNSLDAWFSNMKQVWLELTDLFKDNPSFLGIDSSIAPLFGGESSFIHFIQQLSPSFNRACSSPIFTQVSNFIKQDNPKPIGLCGLMFPCLEDFELAKLYEIGAFDIERNIFLSLHSGLGIDTYPIGIDESRERVLEILQLMLALSNKYQKPLAARFVSDGKTKIGQQSNFENQYLKDVIIRAL